MSEIESALHGRLVVRLRDSAVQVLGGEADIAGQRVICLFGAGEASGQGRQHKDQGLHWVFHRFSPGG